MRKAVIVVLALPFLAMQCKNKNNCDRAICTEVLMSVSVNVTDKNGNNIDLQDHYTINVANGDTIRNNNGPWPEGAYVVLDDSYVNKMYNSRLQFRFVGIKNNIVVVDEAYTISADCCHINKESGKETIVID